MIRLVAGCAGAALFALLGAPWQIVVLAFLMLAWVLGWTGDWVSRRTAGRWRG